MENRISASGVLLRFLLAFLLATFVLAPFWKNVLEPFLLGLRN